MRSFRSGFLGPAGGFSTAACLLFLALPMAACNQKTSSGSGPRIIIDRAPERTSELIFSEMAERVASPGCTSDDDCSIFRFGSTGCGDGSEPSHHLILSLLTVDLDQLNELAIEFTTRLLQERAEQGILPSCPAPPSEFGNRVICQSDTLLCVDPAVTGDPGVGVITGKN
jgi:hypothetical protein